MRKSPSKKKWETATYSILIALCILVFWEIYVPRSFGQTSPAVYTVQKGMGDKEISADLANKGIIKNSLFFRLFVIISGRHAKLQAGQYNLSSSLSIAQIATKIATGDVIKNYAAIIEGWDVQDIAGYMESRGIYTRKEFLAAAGRDYSAEFPFLKDRPKGVGLEGYMFPDTYQISAGEKPEDFIRNTFANFDKKLTPDLLAQIRAQHKSLFEIITMASIIEKEVRTLADKKIIAGIMWKRIDNGMALQVDSTIYYITGKNHASAQLKDTAINSPYNTYKYPGLPLGPICSPGMDSILAAINPTKSDYWYYLSASGTGKTIFSKTLEDHNIAAAKYLR